MLGETSDQPRPKRRWYANVESKVYGPFEQADIAQMIERNQILVDDRVYAEGGSAWIDAGDDPILGSLFHKQSSLLSEPRARRPKRRTWTGPVLVALTLLIIGWIAWPYYAAFSLMEAVREGDVSTLEKRVDWNGVRQAFRGDLNAFFLQHLKGKAKADDSSDAMATGFAALLGPAVVNQMIDGYVTPQAIAALARNENAKPSELTSDGNSTARNIREIKWDHVKYAFFSGGPLTFRVDILPPNDPPLQKPASLEFNWTGDWRLVRVTLPPDAFGPDSPSANGLLNRMKSPKSASDLKNPALTQKKSKPSEPAPIELMLLSKRFKPADYKESSDFQAAILFELSIANRSTQPIRAFDGVMTFTDLLDNEILSSKLAINDPIGAGSKLNWSGSINYNQFTDSHQRLRSEAQENLKVKFAVRKVLYANGTVAQFDD
jgi:hypothetical protein